MTAAVPDPRFRDQLAEDLCRRLREELDDSVLMHTGRSVGDIASWRVVEDLLTPDGAVTRLMEARVQAAGDQRAAEAATDALMWAAWTVEHSPGIKHQARAVTAIRARAALTADGEEA